MTEPVRRRVDANGVALNVFVLAAPTEQKPPLVMLHGMRDVALSLLPVAELLARDFTVYLPDLRGHGRSDRPGNYAMPQFVFDLHCIVEDLIGTKTALFGHSLGGHIVARYAALYPAAVQAAVIVEGLGPPDGRRQVDPALGMQARMQMEGQRLTDALSRPEKQRPLPSIDFAAERLLANNPRLTAARATELAHQGTETDTAGDLVWAFDPRVGSVFLGGEDASSYWSAVRCPTCIATGTFAAEYWGRAMSAGSPAGTDWDGDFAPGELDTRIARFPDAERVNFEKSGHMIHFDEPDRLAEVTRNFLRSHL